MSDFKDYAIEEWKVLRAEIAQKQGLNHRIIFATIGLNFGIYSFSLGSRSPNPSTAVFVMLPVFLVGLALFWILRNDYSAYRIALYIRECIEKPEENQLGWETHLCRLNDRIQQSKAALKGPNKRSFKETHFLLYAFHVLSPLMSSFILFTSNYEISDVSTSINILFNAITPFAVSMLAFSAFNSTLIRWIRQDIAILINSSFVSKESA